MIRVGWIWVGGYLKVFGVSIVWVRYEVGWVLKCCWVLKGVIGKGKGYDRVGYKG